MVKLDFFRVGSCCHPNWVTIQGGGWRNTTFPSLAVLLRHPVHGNYLFDTGYSEHFHTTTKHFPEKIYFIKLVQLKLNSLRFYEVKYACVFTK